MCFGFTLWPSSDRQHFTIMPLCHWVSLAALQSHVDFWQVNESQSLSTLRRTFENIQNSHFNRRFIPSTMWLSHITRVFTFDRSSHRAHYLSPIESAHDRGRGMPAFCSALCLLCFLAGLDATQKYCYAGQTCVTAFILAFHL